MLQSSQANEKFFKIQCNMESKINNTPHIDKYRYIGGADLTDTIFDFFFDFSLSLEIFICAVSLVFALILDFYFHLHYHQHYSWCFVVVDCQDNLKVINQKCIEMITDTISGWPFVLS